MSKQDKFLAQTATKKQPIKINHIQLPLYCPMPHQTIWNLHPRVYLPLQGDRPQTCPYCGTVYMLEQ